MYSVVGNDGQVYGPVDTATLNQWIAEGRVTPTTNLIDPIDGRVVPAGQAPALMGNFPAGPIQAPPMPHGPYGTGAYPPPAGYPRPDQMASYYGPPKSKAAAAVLAFFLGGLGIHRFYLGHTAIGIVLLVLCLAGFVTCGATWFVTGIWALVDFVLILTGGLREANGRALV